MEIGFSGNFKVWCYFGWKKKMLKKKLHNKTKNLFSSVFGYDSDVGPNLNCLDVTIADQQSRLHYRTPDWDLGQVNVHSSGLTAVHLTSESMSECG